MGQHINIPEQLQPTNTGLCFYLDVSVLNFYCDCISPCMTKQELEFNTNFCAQRMKSDPFQPPCFFLYFFFFKLQAKLLNCCSQAKVGSTEGLLK